VCPSCFVPSYLLSDLHRGLRASCETFAEKPNDAPSSPSVIEKEASALLVGDILGTQSLRRSPTPTGFAKCVRDVVPTGKRSGLPTRMAATESVSLCGPLGQAVQKLIKLRYNSANCLSRLFSAANSQNIRVDCLPYKQQQLANEPPRFSMAAFCFICNASPLLEIAFVLVCLDRVTSFIINANHGIM
jgi:hypothetical protein